MIHIVLYEPEIPQNTGNILRSCIAFNATLHVIHPLGFLLSQQAFKRAKMDYGDLSSIIQYDDWDDFFANTTGKKIFVTRYGKQTPDQMKYKQYQEDIYIIFGKESTGIPLELLAHHQEDCIRIPMMPQARSLNLANSVAIILYEVSKQLGYPSLSKVEVQKGADWLDKHK